jgi:hypothetical protein
LSIIHDQADQQARVNMIRERMTDPMSNVSRLLNKLMDKGVLEKVRSHVEGPSAALPCEGRFLICARRTGPSASSPLFAACHHSNSGQTGQHQGIGFGLRYRAHADQGVVGLVGACTTGRAFDPGRSTEGD